MTPDILKEAGFLENEIELMMLFFSLFQLSEKGEWIMREEETKFGKVIKYEE